MADKSKILQTAQRFVAKGQIEKAIREWHKLISKSPNDGNIYNTIGDLYLKVKNSPRAVETYLKGAESFQDAGFALKTIAVYKKLIKIAPENIEFQVKLGDLNVERGMANNAIQDYLTAAKGYSKGGKVKESLGVYRKIADLDPSKTANRVKLAEMCLKAGLRQDAVTELTKLSSYLRTNDQAKEAGEVQEKINKIDPGGELLIIAKGLLDGEAPIGDMKTEEKKDPLAEASEYIEKQEFDKAGKILSPLAEKNPEDPAAHEKLGEIELIQGNYEQALEFIKKAVHIYMDRKEFGPGGKLIKDFLEVDPHRVGAHVLLGEVYEVSGNKKLAIGSFANAIDEYLIAGEIPPAQELYSKIKGFDPEHRDVRRLRLSCEGAPTASSPAPEVAAPAPVLESSLDSTQEAMDTTGMAVQGEGEPSGVPLVDPESLQEYFTEADVFIKYGLPEKAIAQMDKILVLDPGNTAAHEKLKEFYLDTDKTEKAVEECLQLMVLYKDLGENEKREAVLAEAQKLDPENPRIREATDLVPGLDSGRLNAILEESSPNAGTPELPAEEKSPVQEVRLEDAPAALDEPQIESYSADAVVQPGEEDGEGALDFEDMIAEADFYKQQGLTDEARKIYELILKQDPDSTSAREGLDALPQTELESDLPSEEIPKEAVSVPSDVGSAGGETRSQEEIDLEEQLDKSFSLYMTDEPEKPAAVPEPLVQKWTPAQAKSEEKSEEKSNEMSQDEIDIEADLEKSFSSLMVDDKALPDIAPPPSKLQAAEKEVPAEDAELVDLSGLLDTEALGSELEDLFSDYQTEPVEEDEADYESHYNLGIAYKEMGLIDEAIEEFEKALKGPDRFVDSCHMLATCFQESGRTAEALERLEKALSGSSLDDHQELYLRYDMASIMEKENRLQEALEIFNQINEKEPGFKDALKRVSQIEAKLGGDSKKELSLSGPDIEGEEDLELMMNRVFGETSSPDNETSAKVGAAESGSGKSSKKKDRISYL